jgi:hypothetical protein
MRHPMVGWFAWAALVDDAASDGWLVPLGSAGGRCGIRWLVGSFGQRWWTMWHSMVGWFAWARLVDDAACEVGWFAWAALVDHASDDRRCPHRAKIRRVGAAERGTRRFPGFQDHYSIRKCW